MNQTKKANEPLT